MTDVAAFLERAIAALAIDLKVLLRAVQDENLDDELRREAVGAVLYAISAGDLVPDSLGVLGYADDALVCRIALQRIGAKEATWRERYPRLYERLDEDLASARAFLGDELYEFVGRAAMSRIDTEYKGKKASDFLEDPEASGWLADEVSAQSVKLSFRKTDLERELKKLDQILPRLRQKLESSKTRGEGGDMPTIRVFEPPIDGPGFCNSSADPHLVRFASDLAWLAEQGVRVERYDLVRTPGAFVETLAVKEALARGPQVLPLVLVGDHIGHEGSYPSRETLALLAGLSSG